MNFQQPLPILLQAFKLYSPEFNEDYCFVSSGCLDDGCRRERADATLDTRF